MPILQHYKKTLSALAIASIGLVGASGALSPAWAQTEAVVEESTAVVLPDFSSIVEQTEKSVVNIRTTAAIPVRQPGGGGMPGFSDDPYDLFRWFFGPDAVPHGQPQPRQAPPSQQQPQERIVPRGVGSGFIISEDGYVLTNNHVVADSKEIFVTLTDGKEYKASVVGLDERTDVALIKIDAKDLPAVKIGQPSSLKKGQWVLAIGSPFGLDSTVTVGVVSAINRDTGEYLPFIQTDVAVNPGNSGGPLINLQGQVVGMNSQIISRSGGFMGISLAIPIDEVMNVVQQLKADGKVTRGRIGVQITDVNDEVAKALGLKGNKGALVSNVEANGPAAKAGIQSGDVILSFDGKKINQMSDLPRIVGGTKPGTKSTIEVWRKGKVQKLTAQVEEIPSASAPVNTDSKATASSVDRLGLRVENLSGDVQKGVQGVQVVEASGPAAETGLSQGDIIVRINDQDISSVDQYQKVVKGLAKSKAAAVLVLRGDNSQWVLITPSE